MNISLKTPWAFVLLFMAFALSLSAQEIGQDEMRKIYEEVRTPFKYGMVVVPEDNSHKIDCPTVFREGDRWYMTYVVYNGSDGRDGRGYETWLTTSDDLLHWQTLGRLLSYRDSGWDMNQRGGFPALIDWQWGGSCQMAQYKGRHWMSYLGGKGRGYEAVEDALHIGMAYTDGDITTAHEWRQWADKPLMSINDGDAQWWEKLTQYKSTVYDLSVINSKLRKALPKELGKHRFLMFYNAGGVNPNNNLKAERIGIAMSDDMLRWRRYNGNPVYFHEAPGIITGDAQIVQMGDKFVMFYFSAYNPDRKYNAYNTFAVSRDLVHWQDWTGADLIWPTKEYDNMFAHKSYVLKHDNVVYHFYCAVNKAGQRGIAVATSIPMGCSDKHFPEPNHKGRRIITSLNDGWTARLTSIAEGTKASGVNLDMTAHTVNLPHNFDDYFGYRQLKHGNLHGTAHYEKSFEIEKRNGKVYTLQIEGAGTYVTVTLNGHSYGREAVGRTVLSIDITDHLRNGRNEISVEVEHPEMITDMPWVCGGCSAEWGFSEGSQPFGLFRPVSIIESYDVRVEPFGVHIWNNVSCDCVYIDTEVKNYSDRPRTVELVNKFAMESGKQVFRLTQEVSLEPGETKMIHQQSPVNDVRRWNPDDPYLYTLTSMIKDEHGATTDDVTTQFGIRSISWPVHRKDGDQRFLINGKPLFINGTCEYEHLFGQSHAFTPEQIRSRVKMIRQTGFNAFREAHQPHNLLYQQLLDEQGMLFWSQFSAHIWYDSPEFKANFKKFLRRWIRERRNSPSIILWGLQNESVLPREFAQECSDIIREMDPTALTMRAITTCNGGDGTDWNVVQNWSGTYGGSADNYDNELKRPDQLLNGEYGAWRTLGLHGKEKYSEESFSELLMKKSRLALDAADSVCGHFQWLFVSHENPGRVQPDEALRRVDKVGPINYKGLLTLWEQPTEGLKNYHDLFVGRSEVHHSYPPASELNPTDLLQPTEGYDYIYRINCGGDEYTDRYGMTWQQDNDKISTSWSAAFGLNPFMASQGSTDYVIHGTTDEDLFRFFRWGRHKLGYDLDVPNGEYRIELYFIEPWVGEWYEYVDNETGSCLADYEGERIFDVAVNGNTVIDDLDIWSEAGMAGALKKVVTATVTDGRLSIRFPEVKVGQAVISAIAVARKGGDGTEGQRIIASSLPKTYWQELNTDTIAKYPKELLPQDKEAFPATKYEQVRSGEWVVTPGVAREYALRFRYKNFSDVTRKGRLTITDSHGIVLQDREISFPVTPNKFKTLSTTTGTQINAGHYTIKVTGTDGVEFETLEVQ